MRRTAAQLRVVEIEEALEVFLEIGLRPVQRFQHADRRQVVYAAAPRAVCGVRNAAAPTSTMQQ